MLESPLCRVCATVREQSTEERSGTSPAGVQSPVICVWSSVGDGRESSEYGEVQATDPTATRRESGGVRVTLTVVESHVALVSDKTRWSRHTCVRVRWIVVLMVIGLARDRCCSHRELKCTMSAEGRGETPRRHT